MLKIGLLTPGFSANEKDWAIPALDNLVRVLAEIHEVRVFTLRYPHLKGAYPYHRAWVSALGGAELAGPRRLPFLFHALRIIFRAHRARPFDVLHGLWADEAGFLATVAGKLLGIPTVVSLMGGELVNFADLDYGGQQSRLNRLLTRTSLRYSSWVTGGSTFVLDLARARRSTRPMTRLPLGVDVDYFKPGIPSKRPAGMGASGPHVLCVASLIPVKDHRTLLMAFQSVLDRFPSAQLHLVGKGPLQPALRSQAWELGLGKSIEFHGKIFHRDLAPYYQSADIHVLPSRYESQGMAILEAAACGVPTVGSAVGVLPDLGPGGMPLSPGDAEALSHGMIEMLNNPDRRRSMSEAALHHVRAQYTLAISGHKLNKTYYDLVS